jgi:hypothetical protein
MRLRCSKVVSWKFEPHDLLPLGFDVPVKQRFCKDNHRDKRRLEP